MYPISIVFFDKRILYERRQPCFFHLHMKDKENILKCHLLSFVSIYSQASKMSRGACNTAGVCWSTTQDAKHHCCLCVHVCVWFEGGRSDFLTSGEIRMWSVELIEVLMCCACSACAYVSTACNCPYWSASVYCENSLTLWRPWWFQPKVALSVRSTEWWLGG